MFSVNRSKMIVLVLDYCAEEKRENEENSGFIEHLFTKL